MDQPISSDRKKKHQLFCHNFQEHVHSFMSEHALIGQNKKMAISVSGGVDSLALMDVLSALGMDFELIHFNHGTRKAENKKEEELLVKLSQKRGVKLNTIHFNFSLEEKNFEKVAREARQKIYKEFIQKGFWVYTAHHIDDSFEWSLMQSFKQSGLSSTLGIPVFNKGLVRPFMCVTKKQILRYARARALEWLEDASNQNDKFERNFLRLHVTQVILKRYKKALSHYVSRSNQLALMQNLHVHSSQSKVDIRTEDSGAILMVSKNFKEHKDEIKKCIYKFSTSNRGEIDGELDKLIKAHDEMKKNPASFPFKGPMNFSGGVTLYLMKDHLLIAGQKQLDFYLDYDLKLKDYLKNRAQIPQGLVMINFPQLGISFRKRLIKSSKYIHPLLPVTSKWLKNNSISYGFTPLMSKIDRQKLANDAVILDSSVMGL